MNIVLTIITTVLLVVSLLLFVGAFLGTFFNYRTVRKRIKYDQQRSEKGEAVLLKDSFLNEMFYYADKDFTAAAPPADPLGIYAPLAASKWIFTMSQLILVVTLVGVGIALFMTLTRTTDTGGNAAENAIQFKQFINLAFPMIMSVLLSVLMIIYIMVIYKKLYIHQIWAQIQANQTKLNSLHTLILGAIASSNDTDFYNQLNDDSIPLDTIHSSITTNANEAAIVRRLTTLSIRDYFMAEVPSYANSPVRNLFMADPTKQMTTPGLYIRIDCSRTIQNYAYKHDKVLTALPDASVRTRILAAVSAKLNDINKQISTVRLESTPMITLLENFFRISAYYFFFMVVIVLAILIAWYKLGCRIKKGWLWIKYGFLKLKVKILPAGTDENGGTINKSEKIDKLNTDYDKEIVKLELVCNKPTVVE